MYHRLPSNTYVEMIASHSYSAPHTDGITLQISKRCLCTTALSVGLNGLQKDRVSKEMKVELFIHHTHTWLLANSWQPTVHRLCMCHYCVKGKRSVQTRSHSISPHPPRMVTVSQHQNFNISCFVLVHVLDLLARSHCTKFS